MINLNEFMDNYTIHNNQFMKEKNNILEDFRAKEDNLKLYEDSLTDLEKLIISSKIDSYDNIKEKIFNFLLEFNPTDIKENVEKIESVIAFLNSKEHELKKLSEVFNFITKTWTAFLKRRHENEQNSIFINEISEKIQFLYESFYTSGIDDIGRLEQMSDDLKQEVLKIINLFEDFYVLLDQNVFIGKEATIFKNEVEEFLNKDFFESTTIELIKRKEKLSFDLKEILEKETLLEKKALPIFKITRKNKKDYYFYTVKFDDYLLEFQNEFIDESISFIEDTNKFIYLDNYPSKGIFKINEIKETLRISESHFETMLDFENKSSKMFYFIFFIILTFSMLSIFNLINIFILLFVCSLSYGSFYLYFKHLSKSLYQKYNTTDAFFFIPTNYYFLKEGNNNLNYKDLIFNILINADKTILKEKL